MNSKNNDIWDYDNKDNDKDWIIVMYDSWIYENKYYSTENSTHVLFIFYLLDEAIQLMKIISRLFSSN